MQQSFFVSAGIFQGVLGNHIPKGFDQAVRQRSGKCEYLIPRCVLRYRTSSASSRFSMVKPPYNDMLCQYDVTGQKIHPAICTKYVFLCTGADFHV